MKIYLMRHAHAEPGEPMDRDREITAKGKDQVRAMRHLLNDLGVNLDLILSSDFARAEETAERMQHGRDIPWNKLKELRPDGAPEIAWAAVIDAAEPDEKVLIITHDPLIQPMLAAVCFQFSPEHNLFDHANIAHFESDGTFHWFAGAKLVRKMGLSESFAPIAIGLAEHLLRASRRRLLAPIEKRMARAVRKLLKGGDRGEFAAVYLELTRQAQQAGAKVAQAQIGKVAEAKRVVVLPRLPDPVRTAQIAMGQIDFADLDAGGDRVVKIADYEVSKAFHDGMRALAAHVAGAGIDTDKSWEAQPDACDDCKENAEMGWLPDDAPFSSGDFEPPAHPNCRCSLAYREAEEKYSITGLYS